MEWEDMLRRRLAVPLSIIVLAAGGTALSGCGSETNTPTDDCATLEQALENSAFGDSVNCDSPNSQP